MSHGDFTAVFSVSPWFKMFHRVLTSPKSGQVALHLTIFKCFRAGNSSILQDLMLQPPVYRFRLFMEGALCSMYKKGFAK